MGNSNVEILIGSHGLEKSEWLYKYLIDKSRDEKDKTKVNLKEKLYLVVPEQDTNEKQRIIMNMASELGYGSGIINIDVVSFDRIAHNVFDILNIEPKEEKIIDDDAKTMILVLILSNLNKEGKLKYYSKMSNKVGFAKKLTKAVSEFYAYDVKDEDFKKAIGKCDNQATMKTKLEDLNLIFKEFKTKLSDNGYSIKEDKYDKLNEVITKKDNMFNGAIVAFEGFTGFTPVQLDIFKKITKVAKKVFVLIDQRFDDESNKNLNEVFSDDKVFYLSNKFVRDIGRVLEVKDLNSLKYNAEEIAYKYDGKDDLAFVEKNIYNYKSKEVFSGEKIENIEIYEAKNVEEEIINIAHIIKRLVKDKKGLKYNDIRIVVPKVEDYSDKMIRIFDRYDIPLFVDDSKTLLNSPYIETIRAALDVVTYDFSYDSVMRYINSGIMWKNKDIYNLDNFIREYGIRGYNRYSYSGEGNKRKDPGFDSIIEYQNERSKKLAKENKREFDIENTKYSKILKTKQEIFDPLCRLYNNVKSNGKTTIKKHLEAIITFMKDIKLDEKFDSFLYSLTYKEKEEKQAQQESSITRELSILTTSKEVTQETIRNIDSICGVMDDKYTIDEFKKLFDVGFVDKGVKVIPHYIDQVVIGDFMRSRFYNPKVQICMGMNQTTIPASTNDTNLIDDHMREIFKDIKELSQTTVETAFNQRMYIYLALTNPTDKLVLSYPRLNANGESDTKSSVVFAIERLFEQKTKDEKGEDKTETLIKTTCVDRNNMGFCNWNDVVDYIAMNMQELRRDYKEGTEATSDKLTAIDVNKLASKEAVRILNTINKEQLNEDFENILHRKNYVTTEVLNDKLAGDLFDMSRGTSQGSASSIEVYNRCPYKYFLQNTMKLSERKNYEVSSMDLGNFIHSVFEIIFKKNDIDKLIKEEDNSKVIDEAINDALNDNFSFKELKSGKEIFYGNNKLELIKEMTKNLITKSLEYIKSVAKHTKLKEYYEEVPFNYDVTYEENNTKKSEMIEGRIDKVELFKDGDKAYVNVIDYKSGMYAKKINIEDIEAGVSIQLILYLDFMRNYNVGKLNKSSEKIIDLKGIKTIIPCGAFYLWIEDPIISIKSIKEAKDVDALKNEKLAYVGIANSDESVLQNVNDGVATELYSRGENKGKIKLMRNETTGFNINGVFLDDPTGFDSLINIVHGKINSSIEDIKSGIIKASPHKLSDCNYCPYINICKKDETIDDDSDKNKDNNASSDN